jgi:hypothetical protein
MSAENDPGSSKPKRRIDIDSLYKRPPFFRPGFFKWAALFFILVCGILHFFFPGVTAQIIAACYAPFAPNFSVGSGPQKSTETYSLDEIKSAVEDHLVKFGMVDKGATFDWKQLDYTDPNNLTYDVVAHLASGTNEICKGTVALSTQAHNIVVTAQLQGW